MIDSYFTTTSKCSQMYKVLEEAGFKKEELSEEFWKDDFTYVIPFCDDERLTSKYLIHLGQIEGDRQADSYLEAKDYLTKNLKDVVRTNRYAKEELERARNPVMAYVLSILT